MMNPPLWFRGRIFSQRGWLYDSSDGTKFVARTPVKNDKNVEKKQKVEFLAMKLALSFVLLEGFFFKLEFLLNGYFFKLIAKSRTGLMLFMQIEEVKMTRTTFRQLQTEAERKQMPV